MAHRISIKHCPGESAQSGAVPEWIDCLSRAMHRGVNLVVLVAALVLGEAYGDSSASDDFYITITASDLCLCGEGFGGVYGCIDEAESREATSVVISASPGASIQTVQELINAAHSRGFEQVGVVTLDEPEA